MKTATPTAPSKTRLLHALVVDDSEGMRRSVVALLKPRNIRSVTVTNGAEAIEQLANQRFDFVLTDLQMPQVNGIELLEWIQENQPDLPAILMTGAFTAAVGRAALESGAAAVLSKPFGPAELSATLEQVFACSEGGLQIPIQAALRPVLKAPSNQRFTD